MRASRRPIRPRRAPRERTGRERPADGGAVPARSPELLLERALERRTALLADPRTTAWRLFHSTADGIDGLVIEKLGDVLVVQVHEGRLRLADPVLRRLCEHCMQRFSARAVYRKLFVRERSTRQPEIEALHNDPQPWLGRAVEPQLTVLENGVRLIVRPYDGYATGLYLEHRENRRRVRELAAGRRVLNAFSYTCAYSVFARLGGAAGVTSVDISGKPLEWGRQNFAANGLEPAEDVFIRSDVLDYLRRACRRRTLFDLAILDPPTFSRRKGTKRVFSLRRDLGELLAGTIGLLESGGLLLLCCNHRPTTRELLIRTAATAARTAGRAVRVLERPELPPDFHGDPEFAKSVLLRVD
jgi:23S rRNA (cytosine1962-C5)-methyltransferase